MKTVTALFLLLCCGFVFSQENRLFEFGFRYTVMGVKFDLPSEVRWTPVHPRDLQPGQEGITRKADIEADILTTLDFTVGIRPPVDILNHISLGYALRFIPYGDTEQDYHQGIADYNRYIEPQYLAFTYTKLDRTDTFAHELSLNADVPVWDNCTFLFGCRYLLPLNIKWEQGWDRYAEEEQWRSSQSKMSGFNPYIGFGFNSPDGVRVALICSRTRYRVDWDDYADTHCDSWSAELNINVRF